MASLAISRRAALDLIEIEQYSIEQWGRKVAGEYLGEIEDALRLLAEHPSLLRAKAEISDNLKFYRVGRQFLVCLIERESIYVLTVKHGSVDLPERIGELEPHLMEEAEILRRRFSKGLGE